MSQLYPVFLAGLLFGAIAVSMLGEFVLKMMTSVDAVSNIIGAGLGAFGAYLVARYSILADHQKWRTQKVESANDSLRGLLQSLNTEIECLQNIYDPVYNQILELHNANSNGVLNVLYSVTQDYFTIYSSNAHRIGDISNPAIRSDIIRLYTFLKQMIELSNLNNRYYNKNEAISEKIIINGESGSVQFKKIYEDNVQRICENLSEMKSLNTNIMDLFRSLPVEIDSYIKNLENRT